MKVKTINVQRFCTHDGRGIRSVIFTAGCSLRCKWCHNPESRSLKNGILLYANKCLYCGECATVGCGAMIFQPSRMIDRAKCNGCGKCVLLCPTGALENSFIEREADEVLSEALKDKEFFGSDGGITLSGGEPTFQSEVALYMLKKAKENGVTTAIETCGIFDPSLVKPLAENLDFALYDIKDTDKERLKENTGANLDFVLANLFALDREKVRITLRCPIIAGINDNEEHINKVTTISDKLVNLDGIDLLPYHAYGKSKCDALGIVDEFDDKKRVPSDETMKKLNEIKSEYLRSRNIK